MQLIFSPASPYARKVHACLVETGQKPDVEFISVKTAPSAVAAEARAANPTGRIPALVRSEGPAIYDSRVITRYLDARAKAGLYPESRLWEVLTLEATADGILDSALSVVYETRFRPPEHQSEDWITAQWDKVAHAVKAVNDRWMSHLAGPVDMGQIALGCALGYLDFRLDSRGWRKGNDALDDWFAVFSERECMRETAPHD
ncbi:glutathione S-transferase family protein [Marimonas arenosa]|uniref:Glutathione S-transferase family protein n=1 Tax=Marimonas arenosa TaxID=1795305 RepID=A0AAE3WBY3_9RHOB|nr:glutathione S-transferase family protein [Marimonas arenosa]MDQ2089889.1 glutathione S-transferase family protein [Marimonas arenosa]